MQAVYIAIKWAAMKIAANAIVAKIVQVAALYYAGRSLARRAAGKFAGMPVQMTREPAPARRVIYGRVRTSGPMLFAHLSGSSNKYLHLVVAVAGHECEAIEDTIYVDDETFLVTAGAVGGGLAGYMWVYKHLGSPSQDYDTALAAEAPGIWTSDHDLRGIAYVYLKFKWNQGKWPSGLPNASMIVRGKKCYDPRTGTEAWTENPALCLRDYLTDTVYGQGVPDAKIDDASFIAAANVCDEAVALAAGGTEKRYRCCAVFPTDIEPAEVVESLLATMAGSLIYASGKWRVYAGADRAATRAAITAGDIVSPITVRTRDAITDTCNRVKGQFTSVADNWAPTDFPAVTNSTYLAEDNGEEIWRDLDLTWVFSPTQAQRLAKIDLERARQDISVSFEGNLSLLDIQCGDVVPLTLDRYGWSSKLFLVVGWSMKFSPDGAITIPLELREYAATVWDWASGEETTFDAAPNTTLPDPRTVADPTSLTLTSGGALVSIAPDGSVVSPLKVSWTAPADDNVLLGGAFELEFKVHAAGTWTAGGIVPGGSTEWIINGLTPGLSYDVRIRSVNGLGVVGNWVTVSSHVLAGDTTAPAAPTGGGLFADGIVPFLYPDTSAHVIGFRVAWDANTEADFDHYEIKATSFDTDADTTTGWGHYGKWDGKSTSVVLYQLSPAFFPPAYVRIRAVDHSGNASAWVALGNAFSYARMGAGTLTKQDDDDVSISALKLGGSGASSVRQVVARYPFDVIYTLTGGVNYEVFSVSISNRGFSAKPDFGTVQCVDAGDMTDILAAYDYANASNSSTTAYIKIYHRAGTALGAGPRRFQGEFVEFN